MGWGEARSALASIIADKALKPNNPCSLAGALADALDTDRQCWFEARVESGGICPGPVRNRVFPPRIFRSGRGTPIVNTHNRIELLNICENCSSGFLLQKGLQAGCPLPNLHVCDPRGVRKNWNNDGFCEYCNVDRRLGWCTGLRCSGSLWRAARGFHADEARAAGWRCQSRGSRGSGVSQAPRPAENRGLRATHHAPFRVRRLN